MKRGREMRMARGMSWSSSGGSTGSSSSSNPADVGRKLGWLEALLRDGRTWLDRVEASDSNGAQTELAKKELRGWAYDAEDVLDEWKFEGLRREVEAGPVADLLMNPSFGCGVEEVMRRRGEIGQLNPAPRPLKPLAASSLPADQEIYGRDDDRKMLVEFLLNGATEESLNVVPIVGAAGVGKTTLVKHIYNDAKVRQHFGLRGWVSSSRGLQMMELMRATGESLTERPCKYDNLGVLEYHLNRTTSGRRFLLVLDDVWYETIDRGHWEGLRATFSGCAGGSVVILTTQDERVGTRTETVPSYILESLSGDDCWSIFRKHAFGRLPINARLVEIGKKIAEECQGSPLVAKALGVRLRHAGDAKEWEEFLRIGIWDEVVPELQLSYHRLPPHLKRCFVYCSMFPKEHLFNREELVRLWMAQGFIEGHRGRSLEDEALEYFDDLVSRSFFQKSQAKDEAFMMPNLLHALARFISDGECLTVADNNSFSPWGNIQQKHRHFFLTPSNSELIMQSLPLPAHLRSFLVIQRSSLKSIAHGFLDKALDNLNRLRVLDVSGANIVTLPDRISSLKHLRYLNVSRTKIKSIHASILGLYNLQTLNLSRTDIEELPDLLGNLKHLSYINLSYTKIRNIHPSFFELHNLHTLDLSHTDVKELPDLFDRFKLLCFLFLSHTKIERLPESVCKLLKLQTLELGHTEIKGSQTLDLKESDKENDGLPDGIENLSNLRYIGLSVTRIRRLPDSIWKLSKLQTLHLSFTDIEELPEKLGELKRLELLCLNSSKIQRLPESIHELSNLQTLELHHCASLKELPKNIRELNNLQHLTLTVSLPVHMPTGIGKLSNLKTLTKFNVGKGDGSCGIQELKDLLHLEELAISGLCNVLNLQDVEAADLKSKKKLCYLTLMWPCCEADELIEHLSDSQSHDAEDEKSDIHAIPVDKDLEEQLNEHGDLCVLYQAASDMSDSNIKYIKNTQESSANDAIMGEGVLEKLQPHTNLRKLHIRLYGGARFPKWVGDPSFSELTHVVLKNCMKCKALPPLGQLSHLKELDIDGMLVKSVGQDFCRDGGNKGFSSLEKLSFQNMSKWEEWDGVQEDDFPHLRELFFFNCPKLKRVPCLHSPLTKLRVERCAVKSIPATTSLQDLELLACDNLITLSKLPSLSFLRNLTLVYCQNLAHLPSAPLLEKLWVEECEQLSPHNIPCPRNLVIHNSHQLRCFPC